VTTAMAVSSPYRAGESPAYGFSAPSLSTPPDARKTPTRPCSAGAETGCAAYMLRACEVSPGGLPRRA
jgi:hypothetical protein